MATSTDVDGDVGGGVDGDVWWSYLMTRKMKRMMTYGSIVFW